MSRILKYVLIISIILIIVVVAGTAGLGFSSDISSIFASLTNLIVKVYSSTYYTLYDDQYVVNFAAGGNILSTFKNVQTGLACSNYLADNVLAPAANYYEATGVCTLVDSILPLKQDTTSKIIVRSSDTLVNNVSSWPVDETIDTAGNIFCSNALSYFPYASALCASIPECAAFTYGFDSNQNPTGCLKYSAEKVKSLNVGTYTGARTDSKPLSQDYVYLYGAAFSGTPAQTWTNVSVDACQQKLQTLKSTSSNIAGSWSYTQNGTCSIYSGSFLPSVPSTTSTSFLPKWLPKNSVSDATNVWLKFRGSYVGNPFGNSSAQLIKQSTDAEDQALALSVGCNAYVVDGTGNMKLLTQGTSISGNTIMLYNGTTFYFSNSGADLTGAVASLTNYPSISLGDLKTLLKNTPSVFAQISLNVKPDTLPNTTVLQNVNIAPTSVLMQVNESANPDEYVWLYGGSVLPFAYSFSPFLR